MKHVSPKALALASRADKLRLQERLIQTHADLLQFLAQVGITQTAHRIACDVLSRLLQQGRFSEAVPVEWMADRLGVHRNAIGAGYMQLVEIGFCRRISSSERNQPTLTKLAGLADKLVALTIASRDVAFDSCSRESTDSPAKGPVAAGSAQLRPDSTESAPPLDDRSAAFANPLYSTESVHATTVGSRQQCESTGSTPIARNQAADGSTQDFSDSGSASPEELRGGHGAGEKKATNGDSRRPHEFPSEIQTAAREKVPSWVMSAAMNGKLNEAGLEAEWNLSSDERSFLLSFAGRKEPTAQPPRKPCVAPLTKQAHPELAMLIWARRPSLVNLVGETQADVLVDEIAYSVTRKTLTGGVPAALSLVAKGRWSTPRGFTTEWRGAVLRGRLAGTLKAA